MNTKSFLRIIYFIFSILIFIIFLPVLGFRTETESGFAQLLSDRRFFQVVLVMAVPYLSLSLMILFRRRYSVRSYVSFLLLQAVMLFVERCLLIGVFSSALQPDARTNVVISGIISLLSFLVVLVIIASETLLKTPERLFLCIAVPAMLVFAVFSLPVTAPDSYSHIVSAYRFSNLILGFEDESGYQMQVEDYAYLASISADFEFGKTMAPGFDSMERQLDSLSMKRASVLKDVMVETEGYSHMAYYSVLSWMPQVIGITLGRLLGLDSIWVFGLARLAMGLVYLLICIYAIHITPVGKHVFMGVALFPICLNLAVSFNYDSMVIVAVIGFLANAFRLKYSEAIKISYILQTAVFAFLLCGVKGG